MKTKSDIPFLRLMEFAEIKDPTPDDMRLIFGVQDHTIIEKALNTDGRLRMRYKLNLEVLNNAGKFIDAENFTNEKDYVGLFKTILKPRYFWQKVDPNKISVTEGLFILENFIKGQAK